MLQSPMIRTGPEMGTEPLVENQIDDGQRLIDLLVRDGFEVSVAFWVTTSEEGLWHLYIGSPSVDERKLGEAYRKVYASLAKIPDSWISPSDIKLVNATNPIATEAVEVRDRYPARIPARYQGKRLGGLSIREAYVYPPPKSYFKGFDEIKKQFPSAEIFWISVGNTGALLGTVSPFIGKINESGFEGKAPATLMFMGPQASSREPLAKLGFVYRPEGWNALFNPATQKWEEVVHVATGKPLYEAVDFSPLAAMKATA
jgi:hypothetical protein